MSPKKPITFKEALIKSQNICAGREMCESDIRTKLSNWKLPFNYHGEVIEKLKDEKFIDELRYAKLFAKDKLRHNKWGKIKIEFALKQKKIPSEFIKEALNEISETEYDTVLKNELSKKIKSLKDTDEYTIKSKLVRFAASRGFENGKVFDKLSEIIEMHKN